MKKILIPILFILFFSCTTIPKECSTDQCLLKVKPILQDSFSTCLPTALTMVLNYYGDYRLNEDQIANRVQSTPILTPFKNVKSLLKERNYKFNKTDKSISNLKNNILSGIPTIIVGKPPSYSYYHAIVGIGFNKTKIFYIDPQKHGIQTMSYSEYDYFIKDIGSYILVIHRR